MVVVNCTGCTACCRGSARLTEDEIPRFKTMKHENGRIGIALDADGWCVYRKEGFGCLIHDNKPEHCSCYSCAADADNTDIAKEVRDKGAEILLSLEAAP